MYQWKHPLATHTNLATHFSFEFFEEIWSSPIIHRFYYTSMKLHCYSCEARAKFDMQKWTTVTRDYTQRLSCTQRGDIVSHLPCPTSYLAHKIPVAEACWFSPTFCEVLLTSRTRANNRIWVFAWPSSDLRRAKYLCVQCESPACHHCRENIVEECFQFSRYIQHIIQTIYMPKFGSFGIWLWCIHPEMSMRDWRGTVTSEECIDSF